MSASRRAAWASTVVGVGIAAVCLVFLGKAVADRWDQSRDAIAGASLPWLLAAFCLAAGGMVLIALPWRWVLHVVGADATWRQIVTWYFVGEIGKYLPGGIWPLVGRGELATRGGVRRSTAYGSVALSLALLYTGAMVAAGALVPVVALDSSEALGPLWVLSLLPLVLVVLHPAVLGRLRTLAERATRRSVHVDLPRYPQTLRLVAAYLPAWAAIGTATWAVARALHVEASFPRLVLAAVLSWIVGFVVVPVPGGVGVRESAFVAACGLPVGVAATVAIVARLIFVLVDSGGFAVGAALGGSGLRKAGSADADASPDTDAEPGADRRSGPSNGALLAGDGGGDHGPREG